MRKQDWDAALIRVVASREKTPFAWGEHDCCMFASDCIQAMTGEDFGSHWRGYYKSAADAKKLLEAGDGLDTILTRVLGESCEVAFARRGDVVVIDGPLGLAAGICLGKVSVFASDPGINLMPTADCVAAWRIN